ncbi:2-dehydropantoate 2-reductase [Gilbertella persicaria]|uniref:2-dehydropantoate 2-reductase n=1 Tax=Gilbertella persicaria TaxID=101096 RepID=UPI00221E3899|nr:2-dehydropantoate 2-reductase [Gilbertella persicaria]KAI8092148.1 2-dehydropantoate 2-reductase [Gilbertella persicaria]
MSIHILGTGAIGCLLGASLKSTNNKVTLLLRSKAHYEDFRNRQNSIIYRRDGQHQVISGFDASIADDTTDTSPISSLIVSTKANHTLKALKPIASRLTPESTVLLLQNGMGVAEHLMENLWRNESKVPNVMVGVNRHAVQRLAPYNIHHHSGYTDPNAFRIGKFPNSNPTQKSEMIDKIVAIPNFQAAVLPWKKLRKEMLTKLFINSCINGVASVLMCKNKGVIANNNPGGIAMMRAICEEAYEVFKDDLPGETMESMMDVVLRVNKEAGENTCSTLQDIQNRQITEIDYINGYICKMGNKMNINTKSNQAIVNLIHAREVLY